MPLVVSLLTAVAVMAVGFVTKLPCVGADRADHAAARFGVSICYNDVTALFFSRHLDAGAFPYAGVVGPDGGRTDFFEYPVLTGLWAWLVARLTPAGDGTPGVLAYFALSSALLAVAYLVAVVLTSRLNVGSPWHVMIMCASPLLIVHAFTNWDALPIALTAGALLAWARRHPVLAGVLIGLGTAAKLYPVFLLGALMVVCLRAGTLRAWARCLVGAAATFVVVNAPVALLYPEGWSTFLRLNSTRPPEWNSIYFLAGRMLGVEVPMVNTLSFLAFGAACLAIVWLGLRAPQRPRVAALTFLVVAAFLLTNKVWSPQYSLWLLPLLVLALPRWRPVLVWQLAEVVVWFLLTPHLGVVDQSGAPLWPFVVAALVRDACLVVLVALVVKDIVAPDGDVVRRDGVDDPVGGVVDGAPDIRTWAGAGRVS